MARAVTGTLPVAFVLAMSAEASGASAPLATDQAAALKPGMLAGLVDHALGSGSFDPQQSGDRRLPGEKTAQFFPNFPNFFSCISGFWRRC